MSIVTNHFPEIQKSATNKKLLAVLMLLLIAMSLRWGAADRLSHELPQDRDAYLAIARNVAAGNGYRSSPQADPSAFRPPLYPMVLALLIQLGADSHGLLFFKIVCGGLNVICGVVTVWATWRIGENLKLGNWSLLAALLVAVDPLLVRYASMPMTETLFTMLVALLFWVTTSVANQASPPTRRRKIVIGILFGLTAMCRPTIWAFGGVLFLCWIGKRLYELKTKNFTFQKCWRAIPSWSFLAIVMVVSPWVIRNAVTLRLPILMTTHGGYTLLLGNNPRFWDDVVKKPWGTTWSSEGLLRWQNEVDIAMKSDPVPPTNEAETGDWMTFRAIKNIKADPNDFLHACWFRFRRFWNNQPQGNAAERVPYLVLLAVRLFYIIIFSFLVIGTYYLLKHRRWEWLPFLLLILSFTIVHSIFWSNARMRIPLVPAISLIVTFGLMQMTVKFYHSKKV